MPYWNGIVLAAITAFVVIILLIVGILQNRKKRARRAFLAQQTNREQQKFPEDDGIVSPVRIINLDNPAAPPEEPEDYETAVSAKAYPPVLSLFIHAKKDQFFYGYELLQSLLSHGFVHGAMNFFHYNNGHKTLFSIASIEAPGGFDLDQTGKFKTSGLCLFMQPQRFPNPAILFDQMVGFAEEISDDLGGTVEDEHHHLLTEQRLNHWRSLLTQDPLHDNA